MIVAALLMSALVSQPDAGALRAAALALRAELVASPSATAMLARRCAANRLADPPRIRADIDGKAWLPPSAVQRRRLRIGRHEPVVYRRVRLMCGDVVLSEAENWYVPARLTPEIRAVLGNGDTPFGAAIRPLHPDRRTLSSEVLAAPGSDDVLRHRALVVDGEGNPLAEVVETYKRAVLELAPK